MNAEIERALVAIASPALHPLIVVASLTSDLFSGETAGLIVDASGENESPVAALWKLPIIFRLDFPALIDEADQAPALRLASEAVMTWLEDKEAVVEAFTSDQLQLLPNYHIGATRARQEDDRLIAEIDIVAGFLKI